MDIGGYNFTHISAIQPQRDRNNTISAFYPHKDYDTSLPLLPFGEGPFCRFYIPSDLLFAGIYALSVDQNIIYYVGETINLSQRFNRGYGSIQSRACFQGGQATNLRINNNIYHATMAGVTIDLWFYQTENYKEIESKLITHLKPKWNRLGVITLPNSANRKESQTGNPETHLGRTSTCRDEIVECVRALIQQTGKNEFKVEDIARAMYARGTSYKRVTINIHVTSKMCLSGPNLHSKRYDDFEYLGDDKYRLKNLG